jgi:hypothetical protein
MERKDYDELMDFVQDCYEFLVAGAKIHPGSLRNTSDDTFLESVVKLAGKHGLLASKGEVLK